MQFLTTHPLSERGSSLAAPARVVDGGELYRFRRKVGKSSGKPLSDLPWTDSLIHSPGRLAIAENPIITMVLNRNLNEPRRSEIPGEEGARYIVERL